FGYDALTVDASGEGPVRASVRITNTGTVAGKEVAQVYVSAPQGALQKPTQELRAFAKTDLLQPGQSQVLQFEIDGKDLASFDSNRGRWVADRGSYSLRVGASSRDIRLQQAFEKEQESEYTP
ncbi:fibronectin type III-like domain-contianing protein, partial [Stenotrophomonas sp.]